MTAEEIVVADIGGTNARFALARIAGGRVASLGEAVTLAAANHSGLEAAWAAFAAIVGRPLPRAAAIAAAAPVAGLAAGAALKLTNSPWIIRPDALAAGLALDRHVLVNDFGAVAHAVGALVADAPDHLVPLCGPAGPLPGDGVVTIVGPGTGLGVAALHRAGGVSHVVETEGGHVGFAPADPFEDALLARLRAPYGRVSAERIVCGAGLTAIHDALAAIDGVAVTPCDDRALWTAALAGTDARAVAALDRFCLALGGVAGDLALAQGGTAVVIAGGLGLRLAAHLPRSGFAARFGAKGRFAGRMAAMPVRLIAHPQPGLYGAAAAYAAGAAVHAPSGTTSSSRLRAPTRL